MKKRDTRDFRLLVKGELDDYARYLVSLKDREDKEDAEREFLAITTELRVAINEALHSIADKVSEAYYPMREDNDLDLEFQKAVYGIVEGFEPSGCASPLDWFIEDFD